MKEEKLKKKIVVGLVSIWAGGGHNALRDFLLEELQSDKRFELHSYTHRDSSFDFVNDNVFGKMGPFVDLLYKNAPGEYSSISAIKLVKECESFLRQYNPDMVIGTNFGVTAAFELIKKSLKLNFVNVMAIPDYGIPSIAYFPNNRYTRADRVLVFDPESKRGLVKERKYPAEKIVVSGYLTKKSTRDYVKTLRHKTKEQLVREIRLDIGKNFGADISPAKKTFMIAGGAGGIIHKSNDLLSEIAKYQRLNPSFVDKNQFLVITGKTDSFFNKINHHRIRKENGWENIIPIPWIEHKTYAKIQMLSDFPILITVAPASINELLETSCGPIVVYKHRYAQEKSNVNFVVKSGFGYYVPKKKNILKIIQNGFTQAERERFLKNSNKYRSVQLKKIQLLPDDIYDMYISAVKPKLKNNPDWRHMKINFGLISPIVWFYILLMMLPASVLFGFVQYKKGKNKIFNNKYAQGLAKLIGQYYPF